MYPTEVRRIGKKTFYKEDWTRPISRSRYQMMELIDLCQICGEENKLHKVDKMWLCSECENDYYRIDLPNPKLIMFGRTVYKNMLEPEPKWHFKYSIRFMEGKSHRVHFRTSDRVYKMITAFEKPLFWIRQNLKRLKEKK